MGSSHAAATGRSLVDISRQKGLDSSLLYEAIIELAGEGLLTATALDAAGNILLTQLGLPGFFFDTLSKDALKRVLRSIAGNLERRDGELILRSEVSEAHLDVDGGVEARVATPEHLERLEAALNPAMAGHRVEYYFGREHQYCTYIIRPEHCKEWEELTPGESPFAFNQITSGPPVPEATRRRYDTFLRECGQSAAPLVATSRVRSTGETRIMLREDFNRSIVPVVRCLLAEEGVTLNRAQWETYRTPSGHLESICTLYLDASAMLPVSARGPRGAKAEAAGRPLVSPPGKESLTRIVERLHALLSIQFADFDDLYTSGQLTFEEYIFAIAVAAFVHCFVHNDQDADLDIMSGLQRKELRDAMARRVCDADRSEYTRRTITAAIREQTGLVKALYALFDRKFNPRRGQPADLRAIDAELKAFRRRAAILLAEDRTGCAIFDFMTRMVTHVQKTNFYKVRKRSCAFRLNPAILDPLVYQTPVHGLFLVVGFYAVGTHMRAADVARGGLRLIRVTRGNYSNELDAMPLLNYALGPVAQRLKHKDIAESGAKGVIVPGVEYARDGLNATLDITEGIMDLIQHSGEVVDYCGQREMIFFGPDEGTAHFMDAIARRARERRYRHWRTMTTGKSIGIPHDTYGLLRDGRVFGLVPAGPAGTELHVEGETAMVTPQVEGIAERIGGDIDASGMTTMGVVTCMRRVLEHLGMVEPQANVMMTGGPDGDLGANQIQSSRGRICLIVDGGSVLFDPDGLDRGELLKLAMARHAEPRLNTLAYPAERLGPRAFRVPRTPGSVALPDGTAVEDGAYFHRSFLSDPASRQWIEAADIQVFVPCGGFKDTVNAGNVRGFIDLFRELRVIVEGANVFFDDTAREVIARDTAILQIRDSTANKGGVTCSSLAEVLAAFLLEDEYEAVLMGDAAARCELVRALLGLIARNAAAETGMLLALHESTGTPLYTLSVETSEELLGLQQTLYGHLPAILGHRDLVAAALQAYIPAIVLELVGLERTLDLLGRPDLRSYRDAILTKKLAAMALYRHAADWEDFTRRLEADVLGTLMETAVATAG